MASVKGVNITNLDATPRVPASSEQVHGVMRVWYDTYEASSVGSGSDITMARIPAYSTIHDVVLKADALGGSSTLTVGDSDDADRFLAAIGTWNAAGQSQSMQAGTSTGAPTTAMGGLGYRVTSETDILVTTGGATITGSIHLWVHYSTD
tara:strand:+ start:7543 stop:7992 length:450 start_codon:yes stop_codon:yes gene_type:complete